MKRENIPNLVTSNTKSIAVEIGTHQAVYAEQIARNWPGTLCLVDPYDGPHKVYFPNTKETKTREEDYEIAQERMKGYNNVRFIKDQSVNASTRFGPSSVDLVYIDGLHDVLNIVRDFAVWFPKVKVGGVIAGHDFYYYHHTVVAAIHLLANFYGQSIEKTEEECASWYMIKK